MRSPEVMINAAGDGNSRVDPRPFLYYSSLRTDRAVYYSLSNRSARSMSIDNATVRRIARLARLAVDDADVPQIGAELARVLDLADQLASAALADVEPMAHPQALSLVWREDAVTAGDNADAFLALAPENRGGLYLVPKVIG
jgi:aspartyl-tRNA(Asn)/glutamyl-tRNA(Gln) amidotransferase subunit C